jgi:hypothetical protein
MKSKYILIFFFLLFAVLTSSVETKAQSVWGASVIAWDDDAPNIDGLSITAVDYYAGAYYDPYVYGCLYSIYNSQNCISEGDSYGYDYYVPAQVYHPLFQSQRLNTYCTYSEHWAVAVYQVNLFQWWDTYSFSYFGGGEMGNNVPWYGYYSYTYVPRDIYIGWTEACHTVPLNQCEGRGEAECQEPTGSISPVDVVEKNNEKTVNVSVTTPISTWTTTFTIKKTDGTTGSATFDDGSTVKTFTGNVVNQPLTIKGVTESSQVDNFTIVARINNNTDLASDSFTVATISSLEFERIDSTYEVVDANPGNGVALTAEGKRIFPDKINAGDNATDRSLIRVKANVLPAAANLKVYFGSYDLDDPSATATPLDTTGADGKDNKGNVNGSQSGEFATLPGNTCDGALTGSASNNHISRIACTTAGGGATAAGFKVTMQPGDNFAIAASVDETYRNNLNVNSANGAQVINTANQALPIYGAGNPNNVAGIRTEMLTVWRKLHIEMDSMSAVTGNAYTGRFPTAITVAAGTQTLSVEIDSSETFELNRFGNGRVVINTTPATPLPVTGNSVSNPLWGGGGDGGDGEKTNMRPICPYEYLMFYEECGGDPFPTPTPLVTPTPTPVPTATPTPVPTATPSPTPTPTPTPQNRTMDITVTNPTAFNIAAGTTFTLYDDDDFDDLDGTAKDGDTGEDIPVPPDDLAQRTDTPCSATVTSGCNTFAPAYVKPYYDLPFSGDNTPFALNVNSTVDPNFVSPPPGDIQPYFRFGNVATEADPNFWTVYLNGAYQMDVRADRDPQTQDGILGIVDALHGQGALIFFEITRADEIGAIAATRPVGRRYTVVHEIGHLFNGQHGDFMPGTTTNAGLMSQTGSRTVGTFNDVTLNKIRGGTGIRYP